MAISHSEVDTAVASPAVLTTTEDRHYKEDNEAATLTESLADLAQHGDNGRWELLRSSCGLSETESNLLALAAAVEVLPQLGRVYGYLQDLTFATGASCSLASQLFGWARRWRVTPNSELLRWQLLTPRAEPGPWPLTFEWQADPTAVDWLFGADMAGTLTGPLVLPRSDRPFLFTDALSDVDKFLAAVHDPRCFDAVVELVGAPGSGRTTLAAQIAAQRGWRLVAVNVADLPSDDLEGMAVREIRQARLEGTVLLWERAEAMPPAVRRAIAVAGGLSFEETTEPLRPAEDPRARYRCDLPLLGRTSRLRLWKALASGQPPQPIGSWRLLPADVVRASLVQPAGEEIVTRLTQAAVLPSVPGLLSRLPLPYSWEDLVVPNHVADHLREVEAMARLRREVLEDWGLADLTPFGQGVAVLFSGPSGTGKTMAAQVLARSLGVELYRADLAGIVNKYIGETEKHLQQVFDSCKRSPVLLLFDEADALFGKRMAVSSAHDRFANIEIDYLLQCLETFEGLVVLTTNRKADLDKAFTRRLRFVIDFVSPGPAEREQLWRRALAERQDSAGQLLTEDLDWALLATELELTGAEIKSAALAAAFRARSEGFLIGPRHILAACGREMEKRGQAVRPEDLSLGPRLGGES